MDFTTWQAFHSFSFLSNHVQIMNSSNSLIDFNHFFENLIYKIMNNLLLNSILIQF